MKITIKFTDENDKEKEIILEPDKTRNVSIDISETGKIEIFSPSEPGFYHVPLAEPWIDKNKEAGAEK